ncbi:hypothetical protein EG327_007765 [Venturia inaequalis]|nr:hypothetical protein EG327_007765 [Venturia inaequalis]
MVYTMEVYVDGGCRRNGHSSAIGAAAACFKSRQGSYVIYTEPLPRGYYTATPTNQRAELLAIILALETVLARYHNLNSYPHLDVTIYTDSKYAVGCMRTWIHKWLQNGFTNAKGVEVVNRDLIQEASDLDDEILKLGDVKYVWISRDQNTIADEAANRCMDKQEKEEEEEEGEEEEEEEEEEGYSSSDRDYYY